jgi:mRNA interferase MazF
MVITQGDVWWAHLDDPTGYTCCPVVVLQSDAFNQSRIATVVCVPLTSNLKWADAPGNVKLPTSMSGLDKESVANVSQIVTLAKAQLTQRVGKLTARQMTMIFAGIDVVLGR